MAQLRQQFLRNLTVTLAGASTTVVDILGPETDLATPYAEGTDHVIRERQVRQNESGYVNIDLGATLGVAGAVYDVEIWRRAASAAQKGLEAPLFPSGAPAAADPTLQRVVATGLAGDDAGLAAILGGGLASPDVPLLHVRAGEFVRLRAVVAGGAIGPAAIQAKFDLGINPNDTMRLA